jgi:hypothetical protein
MDVYLFAALLGVDFLTFIAAYGYYAYTAPDALRSERYYLQKMAIERGALGDTLSGIFPADDVLTSRDPVDNPIKRIEGQSGRSALS